LHTKSNFYKLDLVFENIVNCTQKNHLRHSLKMALERKPKHVAVIMF